MGEGRKIDIKVIVVTFRSFERNVYEVALNPPSQKFLNFLENCILISQPSFGNKKTGCRKAFLSMST